MEAFPTILLLTCDETLLGSIAAQIKHLWGTEVLYALNWEAAKTAYNSHKPSIFVLDTDHADYALYDLPAWRKSNPLTALVIIGPKNLDQKHSLLSESFSNMPLAAFIKRPLSMPALLRSLDHLRYERNATAGQQSLPLTEGWLFRPSDKIIQQHQGNVSIRLTDKESAVLLALYHRAPAAVSRQQLLEEVWGYSDAITTHTLETHLYRLRNKLREHMDIDTFLVNERGAYCLHMR